MTLQKKELELLFNLLKDTSPNLADARIRDSFMKPLSEYLDIFLKDREEIYKAYCEKKEDGTPDVKDGKYFFKPEELNTINKELQTLTDETVEVLTGAPEKIKELIENTNYSPKVGEVEAIDEIIAKL